MTLFDGTGLDAWEINPEGLGSGTRHDVHPPEEASSSCRNRGSRMYRCCGVLPAHLPERPAKAGQMAACSAGQYEIGARFLQTAGLFRGCGALYKVCAPGEHVLPAESLADLISISRRRSSVGRTRTRELRCAITVS